MEYPTISLNPCQPMAMGYGYNNYNNRDTGCEAFQASNDVIEAVNNSSLHNLNATRGAEGNIVGNVSNSTLHTANLLGVHSNHTQDIISQHGLRNNDAIQGVGKSVTDSEARLTNGQHEIAQEICDVTRDILLVGGKLSGEIGDNKFYMSQIGSDIRREVAKEISDTRKDILETKYDLSRDVNQGFSDVRREVAKEACDIQKEILNNRFENQKAESRTRELIFEQNQKLQAQIAECCCETQKSLLVQSASIRELDQKLSAQNEKLFLEQKIATLEAQRDSDRCRRDDHVNNLLIQLTNINRNTQTGVSI